jgi:Flp pilus assembly protein TadB
MEEEVARREEETEENRPEEEPKQKTKPDKDKEKKPAEEENERHVEVTTGKPWTRWTPDERRKQLRTRRHGTREKLFVLIFFAILLVINLAAVFYSITYQVDPSITITLIIVLFILFITAAFFLNHIFYDTA